MTYRIKTAARLTGIPRNTLLAWERRYQLVEPDRAPNGYRIYSDADISRIISVRQLLEQGLKVGEAVRVLREARQSPEALPSPAGLALALVHPTLGEQLRMGALDGTPIHIAREAASLAELTPDPSAEVDVLVVDLPLLGDQPRRTLRACLDALSASAAVVTYTYAAQHTLRSLVASGVRLVRAPVRAVQLVATVQEVVALNRATSTGVTGIQGPPPPVTVPDTDRKPVPRRFDDTQLARFAETRSAIACECPNHLADLTRALVAFEQYAAQCASNTPEDEALHAWLERNTSRARHVVEEMLWEVVVRDDHPAVDRPAPSDGDTPT